jgi:hypothetical protein
MLRNALKLLTSNSESKGCPLLKGEVFLIEKLGLERWKQLKDAGRKWITAIIVFSSIKRDFI